MHYAFFLGDDTLATALIERGADPFIKNNQGISPFTLTIQKNKQEYQNLKRYYNFLKTKTNTIKKDTYIITIT